MNERIVKFLKNEINKIEEQILDNMDQLDSIRTEIRLLNDDIKTYKYFGEKNYKNEISSVRNEIISKRKTAELLESIVLKLIEIISNKKATLSWLED